MPSTPATLIPGRGPEDPYLLAPLDAPDPAVRETFWGEGAGTPRALPGPPDAPQNAQNFVAGLRQGHKLTRARKLTSAIFS